MCSLITGAHERAPCKLHAHPKSFKEGELPVQFKVSLEWLRRGCLSVYALHASGNMMELKGAIDEFRARLNRVRQRCLLVYSAS